MYENSLQILCEINKNKHGWLLCNIPWLTSYATIQSSLGNGGYVGEHELPAPSDDNSHTHLFHNLHVSPIGGFPAVTVVKFVEGLV